jgi:hypothetical protein
MARSSIADMTGMVELSAPDDIVTMQGRRDGDDLECDKWREGLVVCSSFDLFRW